MGLFIPYSATEIIVPARGKALAPTDPSIAVPEGTYARIGKIHILNCIVQFL